MLRTCLLAAFFGFFLVLSGCAGSSSASQGGGTTPAPPATTPANPTPVIASITPASLLAGSPSQSLTIAGSGFIASTVAQLNGTALATTYQSATSVTAVVPASAIAADGTEKITVSNPAPGGGSSLAQNYSIAVPTPGILGISPQDVFQGAANQIAVTGTGFEANSVAQWNGAPRTTTFTNSTSVQMALTAADVQNFGTGQISVINPGLPAAAPAPLLVRPHTPSVVSFNPASVAAYTGSSLPRQIVITGNGFVTGAVVQANGQPIPVLSQTFTTITVSIPAGYFAVAGSLSIVVTIPSVPPVSSPPAMLPVTASQAPVPATTWVRELNYVPNDIAWDAVHGKLLASMPSTDPTNPNTLLVLDPVAGTVSTTVSTGHNPNLLSISAGAAYLWVGMDGDSSVQRYLLPGFQKDVSIAIPKNQYGMPQYAISLETARVNPHLMAMVPGQWEGGGGNGVIAYDDAVARPNTVPGFGNGVSFELDWIQWGQQDTALYGTQRGTGDEPGGVIPMNVDASGVTLSTRIDGKLAGGGLLDAGQYTYYNPGTGLIYANNLAADPLLFTQVGQFSLDTSDYQCVGDQSVGRYFCVTPTQLLVYDLYHYQLLERVNLSTQITQGLGRVVRWGTSGLAVIGKNSPVDGSGGGLFLIDGAAINPKVAPDVTTGTAVTPYPSLASLTPQSAPLGSSDVTVTINGANFTPSSAACLNCYILQPQTLSTTYVSPTQLIATIPAAQLQTAGSFSIFVYDQQSTFVTPGSLRFTVLPTPTTTNIQALNLSGLAMAWDATRSLLYVGVADSDGVYPNGIISLDPSTATVTSAPVVNFSDPYLLSMSAQDQYLYVGYAGATEASQNYLPGLAPAFSWSLNKGLYSTFDQYYAVDLKAAPQSDATTAISLGPLPITTGAFDDSPGGVAVFDNTRMRPITVGAWPQPGFGNVLAWGKTDATLLGSQNQEPAPSQDLAYNVDGDGVYLAQTVAANLTGRGDQIHSDFGTGLVYSDNGNVADPASGKIVGTFNASGLAAPDSSLNRVFFLSQSQSQTNTNSFTLVSFDQTTYAQVSTIALSNLAGAPFSMVRWGANGLAILTDINGQGGMLYLISDAGFVSAAVNPPANGSIKTAPSSEFQLRWKRLSRQEILQRAHGVRAARTTSPQ